MRTALALSPHLDDAVFSAGGLLTRLSREGWRVVVATIFTASVPDPQGFALACQLDKGLSPAIDYMALRRDEDASACTILGADPVWLPFAEAPHRGYASAAALFDAPRADDDIVERVVPAIARLIDTLAPDLVLAPQAIGAHVDHVAVYAAVRGCGRPLHLWTDFPYAARPTPRRSPFADELATWRDRVETLSDDARATKVAAAVAYRSQLGFQFGGMDAARHAIAADGAIERYACRA